MFCEKYAYRFFLDSRYYELFFSSSKKKKNTKTVTYTRGGSLPIVGRRVFYDFINNLLF